MVDETEALNRSDDLYADKVVELCQQCNLPKTIVTYELGFRLLQEELTKLREELQMAVNEIDTLEHKRNIRQSHG